jgi:hypothetical protein
MTAKMRKTRAVKKWDSLDRVGVVRYALADGQLRPMTRPVVDKRDSSRAA